MKMMTSHPLCQIQAIAPKRTEAKIFIDTTLHNSFYYL